MSSRCTRYQACSRVPRFPSTELSACAVVEGAACFTGGLLNELREGQLEGAVVMRGPSTFGLPPKEAPGSILRRQVRRRLRVSLLHGQQGSSLCCMRTAGRLEVRHCRDARDLLLLRSDDVLAAVTARP